ncbi:MAG TPA: DUF2339 domain-containing protein [Azospirillaceae bacterium]|nr:DUF2339 domain-containing protein [Azospirillaceae bacterium]
MDTLLLLLALVAAAVAWRRAGLLTAEVARLAARVAALEAGRAASPASEPVPADLPPAASPWQPAPAESPAPSAAVPPPVPPAPAEAPADASLERSVAGRWLVWLGAVTLALGGVFLARYAMETGLLGPAVRLSLGFLFGLALVGGGEALRRRPLDRGVGRLRPDQVPAALVAAGLSVAFACAYAAHFVHGLVGTTAAFALLAGLSAAAVALAARHGAPVALLGLAGGFATPALVGSEDPSSLALFAYLALLSAGTLAVARRLEAAWLGWPVLLGAAFWAAIGMLAGDADADAPVTGGFLLVEAALFLAVGARMHDGAAAMRAATATLALGAGATMLLLAGLLVQLQGYGAASLAVLALLAGMLATAARLRPDIETLAGAAAAAVTAVLAYWFAPPAIGTIPRAVTDGGTVPLAVSAAFALAFAAGGQAAPAMRLGGGARRPWLWAAVAAGPALLVLAAAFHFSGRLLPAWAWAAAGLAVTAAAAAAAATLLPRRGEPGMERALDVQLGAAAAAAALVLAMLLREAALTAALSLLALPLAWAAARQGLRGGGWVALAVAALVTVRLTLNPALADYALDGTSPLNWLLYGYGVPAAAFWAAARMLRGGGRELPARGLEAAALLLGLLLPTLEIQVMVHGTLRSSPFGLLETSLRSAVWLAASLGLLGIGRPGGADPGPVRRQAAWWLARLAMGQLLLLHLLALNPLWSGEDVGDWPVANLLLLAYGLPALLLGLYARALPAGAWERRAAGPLALLLAFALVSLEIRQAFHGGLLAEGPTGDAELYAYSAAWLAFALLLLALAIRLGRPTLRYASLAVLVPAVLKVFLWDMADLTGLLRVLSFFGLGLSLIGIGYVYQRFVFPAPGAPGQERGASVKPGA